MGVSTIVSRLSHVVREATCVPVTMLMRNLGVPALARLPSPSTGDSSRVFLAVRCYQTLYKTPERSDRDTRFNKIAIPNNKFQMASRQGSHWLIESLNIFSHLCVARPYQISGNSVFKHIHTTTLTQSFGSLFHSFITPVRKSTFSCPTYTVP